jgi:hypothetical protein
MTQRFIFQITLENTDGAIKKDNVDKYDVFED